MSCFLMVVKVLKKVGIDLFGKLYFIVCSGEIGLELMEEW